MKCSKCDGDTQVIDSRLNPDNRVRRRRKCEKCGYRFTTLEVSVEDIVREKE